MQRCRPEKLQCFTLALLRISIRYTNLSGLAKRVFPTRMETIKARKTSRKGNQSAQQVTQLAQWRTTNKIQKNTAQNPGSLEPCASFHNRLPEWPKHSDGLDTELQMLRNICVKACPEGKFKMSQPKRMWNTDSNPVASTTCKQQNLGAMMSYGPQKDFHRTCVCQNIEKLKHQNLKPEII